MLLGQAAPVPSEVPGLEEVEAERHVARQARDRRGDRHPVANPVREAIVDGVDDAKGDEGGDIYSVMNRQCEHRDPCGPHNLLFQEAHDQGDIGDQAERDRKAERNVEQL